MTITITPADSGSLGTWTPIVGARTDEFVRSRVSGPNPIPGPAMDTVLEEAKGILSHCVSPDLSSGRSAVLVVGYVQSGKTLSFTTLASLARDNGYGAVLVLAGTTNDLKDQTRSRLVRDLGIESLSRDWTGPFDNPNQGSDTWDRMRQAIERWRRRQAGVTQEDKPAVVITVLKHAGRISEAAVALTALNLVGVPVLIVDDESDQAGLDSGAGSRKAGRSARESPTHEAIRALRDAVPHHSLVQYTATPQGNLLLAATDLLNPEYVKVLTSGPDYTGGQVFFDSHAAQVVRPIDGSEVYDPKAPPVEPPEGLQQALKIYLLGIADFYIKGVRDNRSMMVQPHQQKAPHAQYQRWIAALRRSWQDGLMAGGAFEREVRDDFEPAYRDLAKTVDGLSSFDDLMAGVVERISDLQVVQVNSTAEAERQIHWKAEPYWILIGGMKLDRGFTVEGLTVTYMPRRVAANADVLQQRARFFGYRGSYIDYCRVYLPHETVEAFKGYVADEEFLRKSLLAHEGRPLSEWRRDFVLHRQFSNLTRTAVQGRPTRRRRQRSEWHWPRDMHLDEGARAENRELFESAFRQYESSLSRADQQLPGVVDLRTKGDHHAMITGVELSEALDFLLSLAVSSPEDSMLKSTLMLEIARLAKDQPELTAAFVFMGGLKPPSSGVGRSVAALRTALHVGMSPQGATGGAVRYSGDAKFFSPNELTIQLRLLRISDTPPPGQEYGAVPWLAVRFPEGINHDFVVDLE